MAGVPHLLEDGGRVVTSGRTQKGGLGEDFFMLLEDFASPGTESPLYFRGLDLGKVGKVWGSHLGV